VESIGDNVLVAWLDLAASATVRDIKIRLLYYILNGGCFAQRYEGSHPSPDRSGCLCITSAFPSALSIIVSLLKDCPSSKLSTENLYCGEYRGPIILCNKNELASSYTCLIGHLFSTLSTGATQPKVVVTLSGIYLEDPYSNLSWIITFFS